MKPFKFFWTTHKWTGILFAAFFATISVTGFLLLVKKEFAWIQPPTQETDSRDRDINETISMKQLHDAFRSEKHPDFRSWDDIDRIDFRPSRRIFKVRSKHNYSEMQIDAISGRVLSTARRNSDFIEQIHDGSILAGWFHDFVMPFASFALMFLVFSGLWLWLDPKIRKWRRKRKRRANASV